MIPYPRPGAPTTPAGTVRRDRRRRAAATAAAVISLLAAGCSSGSSDAGSTGGGGQGSARQQAVRFSACMRENGVSAFPDPDASGRMTIDGILNGSSLDPDAPEWKTAIAACKGLQPPGFTGKARSSTQQQAALEFARCMRDNGVEDFPDPTKGQPLVDTNRIPSSASEAGMSRLDAAMQKCGSGRSEALGVDPR